jgi:hypothetical protein
MRKTFTSILVAGLASIAAAQTLPVFVTLNNAGTSASAVFFQSDPQKQIRIVGAIGSSDKAASLLSFRGGVAAYTIGYSNASGTTVTLTSTNGLVLGSYVMVQRQNGLVTNSTISAIPNNTNVTLSTTTGFFTLPGDELYVMSSPVTLGIGANTNKVYQGDAIYVGTRGRPVWCILDGTSYSSLDSISARYE